MRVHVHGNCQAPAIAGLLREQFENWTVTSYEVFGETIINELDRHIELIRTADVVISQPIHDGYRDQPKLGLSWIRNSIGPGASLVVFPSMFFDGQLIGCRSMKIPAYGMPYHDVLLVHLVVSGVDARTISAVLLSENLYPIDFLENEIAISVDEMRFREEDEGIDIPLSEYLQENSLRSQIFHVTNHPCRPALVYTASKILSFLGYKSQIATAGRECLQFPHIPVLPSVERFMTGVAQLPQHWMSGDQAYFHLLSGKYLPEEYHRRCVDLLTQYDGQTLSECLNHEYVRPFLARVAQAGLGVPYIDKWREFDTKPARVGRR